MKRTAGSREQNYRPEDCGICRATLVGKRGSGFWEGGKGNLSNLSHIFASALYSRFSVFDSQPLYHLLGSRADDYLSLQREMLGAVCIFQTMYNLIESISVG